MASDAAYKSAAEKIDITDAELDAEEKRVAALEADLAAAEARIEAAQKRHQLASQKLAEELAKPLTEPAAKTKGVVAAGPGLAEVEAKLPSDGLGPDAASKGGKNTSAKTEKEVSRDRWLAKRTAEGRVRNQAKKAKEKLRSYQRGKRMEYNQDVDTADAASPAPAPTAPAKPAFEPKERSPLFESDEVKQGAKGLAERLIGLKDRPNLAEKRAAALKVLCGGRENYYTSEPADVLADLEKRGLVDAALTKDLTALVSQTEAAKGGPIPPEEWLAHAQKVSELERKDDAPYKESEVQYLKWVDRIGFVTAEAELDAAEQKLEELLRHVDACIPVDDEPAPARKQAPSGGQEIDEDYAAQLEDKYDQDRQSKGMKNTSALPDKVVSKEKWLAERGTENREFEKNIKAREARREEARDLKKGAADVADD